MSISATIGGNTVTVLEGSYKFNDTVDLRDTLEFTVHDSTGSVVYQVGQPVTLTDSVNGFQFSGFVNDATVSNITPNANNLYDIKCGDNTTIPARQYSKKDYENQFAGDIAVDLVQNYLAQDGVTGAYAIRRDTSQADFSTGTLSGTVAANNVGDGDLELAPAGTDFTQTISPTAVSSFSAIKFVGTAIQAVLSSSNYEIHKIYVPAGTTTVLSGDYLQYDVWVQSDSPAIMCGVDIVFTDGSTFGASTGAGTDAQGMSASPATDLSGYANDQWFTRSMGVAAPLIGKTIAYFTISFQGTKTGTYTAYIRRVIWANGITSYFTVFGDTSTSLQNNSIIGTNGYTNAVLSIVQAHDKTYNTSYTYSLSSVVVVKNSDLTWTSASIPSDASIFLQSSVDLGASRQSVINSSSISNLPPGFRTSGKSLYLWFYAVQGKDPTGITTMPEVAISVRSAPANNNSGSDVSTIYDTSTEWNTGTLTNVQNGSFNSLALTGVWTPFAQVSDYATRITTFGGGGLATMQRSTLVYQISASSEVHTQFNWAGTWQNFVAEMDIQILSNMAVGFIYRTTAWSSNPGSPAYFIALTTGNISLYKGQNAVGGGSSTLVASAGVVLTSGTYYHLKAAIHGAAHNIYINDVLVLSVSDSTYSGAGYIGIYSSNIDTSSHSYGIRNFGVTARIIGGSDIILSGTWTSPTISLSPANIYGNSVIAWDATTVFDNNTLIADGLTYNPPGSTILVETTINGGSTWQTVANGGVVPGLTAGQSLSGVNLQVRITLSTIDASYQPQIGGLSVWLTTQYQASGYRITPTLPLTNVGIVGSTLASWDGVAATNTTFAVASSIDSGTTWTNIGSGATGSGPIAGVNVQPDPVDDTFDTNTSSSYSRSALTTPATWAWDTTNSRVTATGGNGALLLYNSLFFANGDTMADLDQADASGIVARANGTTMYALVLYDSSAIAHQNAYYLYKIISGAFTQLATGAITFTRGTPYRFHLITNGTAISATMDGTQIASVTDSGITAAGMAGLISGSLARVYQFRAQAYGENVSSLSVLLKQTLTSTDPTADLQLTDLTLSAYGPDIQPGALIPKTNYSVYSGSTNTIAADLDDLVKQSSTGSVSFVWDINKNLNFIFRKRTANPSPWIATGADILISTPPQVENIEDLFRNIQFVTGGSDILPFTKTFTGDGNTQTWTLDYPVDALTSVTINSVSTYTIGVQGVDTGRNFYYTAGSPVISQDTSGLAPVATQKVTFGYNAQVTTATEIRNDAAIATRAALDNTTGVVQEVEDGSGLSKIACLQKNLGLLNQYSVIGGRTFTFLTKRAGLASSQILTMFVPQFSVHDGQFLITDVSVVWKTTMANNVEVAQPFYSVTATSGPVVGNYVRFFSNIITGVGR